MFRKLFKKENGETVVEATMVVPIVIIVIFLLIYLGFVLYQQTILTVVANDTAASIGQVYATPSKDPFVGYTNTEKLSETKLYRNLYNAVGNAMGKTDTVDGNNELKAQWFAKYRLASTQLYKEKGSITYDIGFERQPGTVLQKIVVVKIKATYDLPFLKFFGISNSEKLFEAEARAQCFDLLDYSSTLSLVNTVLTDSVGSTAEKINKVFDAIKDFKQKLGE